MKKMIFKTIIIQVMLMLMLMYSTCIMAEARNNTGFELPVMFSDSNNKPLSHTTLRLMRENNLQVLAKASTDADGIAVFNLADNPYGRYYVCADIKDSQMPPGMFFDDKDTVNMCFISSVYNIDKMANKIIKLVLDWNNYIVIHEYENYAFDKLYIRGTGKDKIMLALPGAPQISLQYVFLPMKSNYQLFRSQDEMVANNFVAWWDFYALPGAVVNLY